MKKGISFSVVPLIALVGVLGLSIWAGYQLSFGGSRRDVSVGVSTEDESIQKLEQVKNMLLGGLEFSFTQAVLEIAENGGTGSKTFWYCTFDHTIPEPEEVEFAISQRTRNYLNAYVSTATNVEGPLFEIEAIIPEYTCVGVFNPGEDSCDRQNSQECEEFATSATAGPDSLIEISDPVYVNDGADLEAHLKDIRFYWLYYRLYNDFDINDNSGGVLPDVGPEWCHDCYILDDNDNLVTIDDYEREKWGSVSDCVDENRKQLLIPPAPFDCPGRISGVQSDIAAKWGECIAGSPAGSIKPQIEEGLENICDHYNNDNIFDDYVTCTWEITCFSETNGNDCLASQCDRGPTDICDTAPTIYFQAKPPQVTTHESGSVRFKITLEDSKYRIPSGERHFQNLVWNIYGAIQLGYPENCPILGVAREGGGGPSTPSV